MNTEPKSRREFIKTAGVGAAAMAAVGKEAKAKIGVAQTVYPRWRGFNLMEVYTTRDVERITINEEDFMMMSDLGFDFLRLPTKYMMWIHWDRSRPISFREVYNINERGLEVLDTIMDYGEKYGIHINLGFHHGPGYCVNAGPEESFDLWTGQDSQDAFCFHWQLMARRYSHIPSSRISFNLLNEPSVREDPLDQHSRRDRVPAQTYYRIVKAATEVIREENPNHIVIADGQIFGMHQVEPMLIPLGVGQAPHAYDPGALTHYQASWSSHADETVPPKWPGVVSDGVVWDRQYLERYYSQWVELARQGIGVHCGECGCYTRTPHDVVLAWFRDVLEVFTEAGIGYSLWNFRGAFGILDSGRPDVDYEDWHGHKLDRKLLTLLQEF